MTQLEKHILFLKALEKLTISIAGDIVFASATVAVAKSKNRIFRDGKKTNNTNIGIYSKKSNHKKAREIKGRQVNFVDLKFTGGLQNADLVKKDANKITHVINGVYKKRSEGLEYGHAVYGKAKTPGYGEIFTLNKDEIDYFVKTSDKLFKNKIQALASV